MSANIHFFKIGCPPSQRDRVLLPAHNSIGYHMSFQHPLSPWGTIRHSNTICLTRVVYIILTPFFSLHLPFFFIGISTLGKATFVMTIRVLIWLTKVPFGRCYHCFKGSCTKLHVKECPSENQCSGNSFLLRDDLIICFLPVPFYSLLPTVNKHNSTH